MCWCDRGQSPIPTSVMCWCDRGQSPIPTSVMCWCDRGQSPIPTSVMSWCDRGQSPKPTSVMSWCDKGQSPMLTSVTCWCLTCKIPALKLGKQTVHPKDSQKGPFFSTSRHNLCIKSALIQSKRTSCSPDPMPTSPSFIANISHQQTTTIP